MITPQATYFGSVTVTGAAGRLLIGPATAAILGAWTIRKVGRGWQLSAAARSVDPFLVRQKGLGFTAPRAAGFWCWPVVGPVITVGGSVVMALGAPER